MNVEQLIRAALAGEDEIASIWRNSVCKGAQALRESASAFERWCDNRMIEMLKAAEVRGVFGEDLCLDI